MTLGQSVDKIIMIILSLKFTTSKNENIDHQGKETCAYENNHIFLLCDSTVSFALNFCFSTLMKKIIVDEK